MTITIDQWPGFMPGRSDKGENVPTKKVIITKGTVASGKRYAPDEKGKPVEVDEKDARLLCAYGHAVPFENREAEMKINTKGK